MTDNVGTAEPAEDGKARAETASAGRRGNGVVSARRAAERAMGATGAMGATSATAGPAPASWTAVG